MFTRRAQHTAKMSVYYVLSMYIIKISCMITLSYAGPGLTGSQLWGTVRDHYPCNSINKPIRLWIGLRSLCTSTLN